MVILSLYVHFYQCIHACLWCVCIYIHHFNFFTLHYSKKSYVLLLPLSIIIASISMFLQIIYSIGITWQVQAMGTENPNHLNNYPRPSATPFSPFHHLVLWLQRYKKSLTRFSRPIWYPVYCCCNFLFPFYLSNKRWHLKLIS